MTVTMTVTVAALYRFATLPEPEGLRAPLLELCRAEGLRGTLLLAQEGINGTVAGREAGIAALLAHLDGVPGLEGIAPRRSLAPVNPFARLKVRVKPEIVTMGVPGLDAARQAGTHVEPADWNALIAEPGTLVIDTRNAYETAIGTFAGALDPGTESFRDFPAWVEANRERLGQAPRIAMFCTGGIRCEKATALLRAEGFADVFHLKGGILAYLESVPEAQSLWRGECFVFDDRVSVDHSVAPGGLVLCHACRTPVSAEDRADPRYEEGVSCPACHAGLDEARRASLAERQRQVMLARARGTRHVGADVESARAAKLAERVARRKSSGGQ